MQHETDVRNAAQRFSEETLTTLYSGTLVKIHEAGPFARKIAHATFASLLCLYEPLSSTAFLDVLRHMDMDVEIKFQPSELPRICHHLVVFDTKLDKLRFAHTSIQDFLQAQPEFSVHAVNSMITKACLNAYMYGSPVGLESGLQPREHFYQYGALYWPEHFKASPNSNDLALSRAVEDFIFDDTDVTLAFCGWLKDTEAYSNVLPRHHLMIRAFSDVTNPSSSPIFTASVFGVTSVMSRVIESNSFNVEHKNDVGATGLYLACACGHQTVASTFLEYGADPNATGGKFGCPLQAACFNGFVNIAKLLLSRGADPKRSATFDNALQASLEGGSEELALAILEDRSKFEIDDQSSYDNALQMAAQVGHEKVVRYLQRNYPLFGHSGPAKSQAIQSAISKGQLRTLQPFIDDTQGQRKDLPAESIAIAALYGQDRVIQFLLGKNFDIEKSGPFGKPVRAASLRGHDSTVRLLINSGASASASDCTGNALEAAAINGHTSIASFLLQMGVNPDASGGLYGTALQASAFQGHLGVSKLLLDAGAKVHQRGSYKDAFHAAAAGGSEKVIGLLLDQGFRLYHPPPPRPANMSVHFDPPRDILAELEPSEFQEYSADWWTELYSSKNDTLLATAVSNGRHHIVELILQDLRDVLESATFKKDIIESCGLKSAILEASSHGYEKMIHILLKSGLYDGADGYNQASLELMCHLRDSLNHACLNGHVDCVKALMPRVKLYEGTSIDGKALRWTCSSSASCRHKFERPIADELVQQWEALHPFQNLKKMNCYLPREVLLSGCRGDQIPIVQLGLDLLGPHYSAMQIHQVHIEAFLVAAWHGSIEAMKFLLRKLEIANSSTSSTTRPSSLSSDSKEQIRPTDCDPQQVPRHGDLSQTLQADLNDALIYAAHNGHFGAAKFLISEGADAGAELQDRGENRTGFCSRCGSTWSVLRPTPLRTALNGFTPCQSKLHQGDDDTERREEMVFLLLQHGALMKLTPYGMADLLKMMVERCPGSLIGSLANEIINKDSSFWNTTSKVESALKTAALREIGSAAAIEAILQTGVGRLVVDNAHQLSSHQVMGSVLDTALKFFKHGSGGHFPQSESIASILYDGPGAVIKKLVRILPRVRTVEHGYALLMQMAVAIDDKECVELLLSRGIDVNRSSHYYGTALQCASRFGRLDLVRLLLLKGAEVNILSGKHETAIRAAVLGGHEAVVNVLIKNGAKVNLRGSNQKFGHILNLALRAPQIAIIESLTTAGANIHPNDIDEPDVLNAACKVGDVSILKLLLNNKCDACHRALSGLDVGVYGDNNVWSEDDLLLPKDDGDQRVSMSETPLQAAAYAGHASVALFLIEAGASIDHYNSRGTALSIAARKNNIEAAKVLLRAGARVCDQSGRYNALKDPAHYQYHEMVELLLEELSDTPVEDRACDDALCAAALMGNEGICRMILDSGALVSSLRPAQTCGTCMSGAVTAPFEYDMPTVEGSSESGHALHIAAYQQYDTIVRLLLARGADATHSTAKYGVPIQAALKGLADRGHMSGNRLSACESIVRILLEYSPDVNPPERGHGSPLQLAAYLGSIPIVQLLLGKGADMGQTSERFGTVLMAAIKGGNGDIVELLLQEGADANQFHVSHGTALQMSSHNLMASMVDMLLNHGADASAADGPHGSPLYACLNPASPSGTFGQEKAETIAKVVRVAKLLLPHSNVQPSDLVCAVRGVCNSRYNHEVIDLLFEHGKDLRVTEGTLVAAIKHLNAYNDGMTLFALLRRYEGVGVTQAMIAAVNNMLVLKVLLEHQPDCQISPQNIIQIAWNSNGLDGRRMVRLLLDHQRNLPVGENIVLAVLGIKDDAQRSPNYRPCQSLIDYIFDRDKEIEVTEAMLEAASTVDDMRSLLKHAAEVSVTTRILQCAADIPESGYNAGSESNARNLVRLLLAHDLRVTIEQPILDAFTPWFWDNGAFDYLNLLLERGPNLRLTGQLFLKVSTHFRNFDSGIVEAMGRYVAAFEQHGKHVEFTDGDFRAIAANSTLSRHPELLALAQRLKERENGTR